MNSWTLKITNCLVEPILPSPIWQGHDARCYPSRRAQLALRFLRVAVAPGSGARGSDIPGLRCGGGFFMFFPIGDGSKLRWSMVSGFWMFLDGLEHDFYFCIYWE